MPKTGDRFLSAVVDPPIDDIAFIAAERVGGQWCLYGLNAARKIVGAQLCSSLETVRALASEQYGVPDASWSEDRPH